MAGSTRWKVGPKNDGRWKIGLKIDGRWEVGLMGGGLLKLMGSGTLSHKIGGMRIFTKK